MFKVEKYQKPLLKSKNVRHADYENDKIKILLAAVSLVESDLLVTENPTRV